LTVFRDITLSIYKDEFVSLIGPSGCGKTTLLSIVAGLLEPTAGRVLLDGKPISGPGRDRGVVFQQDAIFPWRKVIDNVRYGLEMKGLDRKSQLEVANQFLRLVGLENFAGFYPKELSGGMKKRVALAMVFANDPEVYLMDEPFGSLDYATKVDLQKQLLKIWREKRKTTLFVTHDLEEALFLSDRIVVLANQTVPEVVEIPFDRPRTDGIRTDPAFQELKRHLWIYLG
jgi:NitT/TauT family transport system ATP-binding protein